MTASDWHALWSINEANWQPNQYNISTMLWLRVSGCDVKEVADSLGILWANFARALSGRLKADYHSNKSFNLCSKAFLWNWRLSILTEGKEQRAVFEASFFLSVRVRVMVVIRQNCEAFKRFSDMDFLQIRVINFNGHLMRGRWKEKEGDVLRSPCSDVQNRNSTAAIRYLRVHSTLQGH